MSLALEKVAREVEWFAFNGTFADGANATPGAGTREMRGLSEYCALNANADNDTAPTLVSMVTYTTTIQLETVQEQTKFFPDAIANSLKRLYDASAPMVQSCTLRKSTTIIGP